MEFWPETGPGDMSVPNVVTCLSPWDRNGAIRSRLARISRARLRRLIGLDRMSSARQGLTKQVSTHGNVSFPVGTAVVPSGDIDVFVGYEQTQAPSAPCD